jgi:hypothetical protein
MPNPSLIDILVQAQPPQAPPPAAPPPAPPSVPEHQLRAPLTRGEFFATTPHPFLAKMADISTGPGAQFLLSTAGAVLGGAVNPLLGAGLAAAGAAVPPAMRMFLANRGLIPPPAPGETEPEITPRGIAQEAMSAGVFGGIPGGKSKTAELMKAFDRTVAALEKKPLADLLKGAGGAEPEQAVREIPTWLQHIEPETLRMLKRKHIEEAERFFDAILKTSATDEERLVLPEEIIAIGAAGGAAPWYHEGKAVLEKLLGKEDYRRWAAMHAALSPQMPVPAAMAVAFDLLAAYSRHRRTLPVLDALRFAISEVMGKPGQTGMTTHVPNLVRGMLQLEEQLEKFELATRIWFSGNKVRDFYSSLLAEGGAPIDTLVEKALFLSPELLEEEPLAKLAVETSVKTKLGTSSFEFTTPGYLAAKGVVAKAAPQVRDLDIMRKAARQMLEQYGDEFKSEYLKGLGELLQSAMERAPEHGLTPMEGQAAIWAVFRLINELGVVHMAKTIKAAEAAGKKLTKQQFKELIPTAITDNVLEEMQKPGILKDIYSDMVTLIAKDQNVREAFQRFLASERASTQEQLISAIERASQIVEERLAASRIPAELLTPGFRRYVTHLLERAAESGEFTVSKNLGDRQTVLSFLKR